MSLAARREVLADVAAIHGRSLWQDARRRLLRNRAAVVSMIVLGLIAGLALLAPWLSPHPYDEIYWERILAPPDFEHAHWFGTDGNGRDLFVRTLYGARVSLMVGLLATAVSLLIGVTWGAVAGYFGGRVDNLMMRFVDIMYSLPFMFFVILLMVVFGRHIFLIFVAIGAVEWLTMARIVRGQTLSVKGKEFIEAARAAGVRNRRIITRHVIPNVLGPVIVYVTLTVPHVILIEFVPVVPRARRPGAADQLGRPDRRGRRPDGIGPLAPDLPRHLPRDHAVLLQLHRRRPARRPRPEGSLRQARRANARNDLLGFQADDIMIS